MFNLPLIAGDVERIIVFASFAVGYTAYYAISHSQGLTERFHRSADHTTAEIRRNLLYRGVMVLVFGVVPAVLLRLIVGQPLREYGLRVAWSWAHAGVILGLSLFVALLIFVNPGKKKLIGMYPQMRIQQWSPLHLVINTMSWAAYLLAYELMFRGFMLRALLPYGAVTAVALNIAFYVAVHVPKGVSEAVGAIPFGLVVCYLSLQYGTIWPAFFLHLSLAMANSYVALAGNPEMKVVWSPTSSAWNP